MSGDRLATIGWVFRPAQYLVVQSLLLQMGIPVCPIGYHHLSNQWPYTLALGGIELRVPEARADEARVLLASLPPLLPPAEMFGRNRLWRLLLLVGLYLFALAPPPGLAAELVPPRRERAA